MSTLPDDNQPFALRMTRRDARDLCDAIETAREACSVIDHLPDSPDKAEALEQLDRLAKLRGLILVLLEETADRPEWGSVKLPGDAVMS